MSQENVEIARAAIEAVLRRPKPDYEAMNALFYPNYEFLSYLEGAVEGRSRSHRGHRAGANTRPAWRRPLNGR
jgi:hypothetical protein